MWTRKELKTRGKMAFRANYWICVLVALILLVLLGSGMISSRSGSGININIGHNDSGNVVDFDFDSFPNAAKGVLALVVLGAVGAASIVGIAVSVFLQNPLEVSGKRFFFLNSYQPADLGELKYSFTQGHYLPIVKTMFLTSLYTFLWSLLLIIPGIIKSYSYRMVPFILAEDPTMDSKQAIDLSRSMMNGNKWRAFVLDLSFIGWYLLSALTAGLLLIFWVGPYVEATDAELYRALRENHTN